MIQKTLDINSLFKLRKFAAWLFLAVLFFIYGCEEPTRLYLKARSPKELKTGAYDLCGRDYQVLNYEDDTALVECLKPLNES